MAGNAYVGDIGTIILIDTQSDLTDNTLIEMKVKKPSGAEETWDADIPVGMVESDGFISHTTESGDFDEAGKYLIQAHVTGAGRDHLGKTANFIVKDPYE